MAAYALEAQPRERLGTSGARAVRRAGRVPAVVYGKGLETQTIEVEAREFERLLREGGGAGSAVTLTIAGQAQPVAAVVKEINRVPASRAVRHIDFQVVS